MISLLLPTRQRPSQLNRLAASVKAFAADPDRIELVTYIDDDDPSYDDLDLGFANWVRVDGPRLHDDLVNLSVKWNDCYAACTGDILMHCGDDIVFRTSGWDAIVRDAFNATPENILFAYGRDGIQDANRFGTHGFIHRDWVEAVGYLFPPLFVSDYNDTFLNDVARGVGRHQEIPIFTEHMHYVVGKADIDLNTAERLRRHADNDPRDLYYSDEVQEMIRVAVTKLQGVIQSAVDNRNPDSSRP